MTKEAVEFSNIGDMIDMAIGTPEVGVVDFNMLAAVLHCIAQQMRARNKIVELRGNLPSSAREPSHTVAVTEYAYDTVPQNAPDESPKIKKKGPVITDELPSTIDQNTILVVERVIKDPSSRFDDDPQTGGASRSTSKKQKSSPSVGRGGEDGGKSRDGGQSARDVSPDRGQVQDERRDGSGQRGGKGRDSDLRRDGGSGRDGGLGRDGGSARDGGSRRDGGSGRDSDLRRGGGSGRDSDLRRDGGSGRDGGPGRNDGSGRDGVSGRDGGSGRGGGSGRDGDGHGGGQKQDSCHRRGGGSGQREGQGRNEDSGQSADSIRKEPCGETSAPGEQHADRRDSGTRLGPRLSLVTISKFNALESVVEDLKNRVYGSMPKNEDILQEVRSQSNLKAITDMWTSLNVSSRLEAAETGLAKLSSLLQDVINDPVKTQGLQAMAPVDNAGTCSDVKDFTNIKKTVDELKYQVKELNNKFYQVTDNLRRGKSTAGPEKSDYVEDVQEREKDRETDREKEKEKKSHASCRTRPGDKAAADEGGRDADSRRGSTEQDGQRMREESRRGSDESRRVSGESRRVSRESRRATEDTRRVTGESRRATEDPRRATEDPRREEYQDITYEPCGQNIDVAELIDRMMTLELRVEECCENVTKTDGVAGDTFNSIHDQLDDIRKRLAQIEGGSCSAGVLNNMEGLMEMFDTVKGMQEQLKEVHETARALTAEREEKRHSTNALLEQIELLKTIKLDREDMEEALADKANLQMLTRKVSREQFEMACSDLSRTLEMTLNKLSIQEELWQQALDDIQREIESKLDKMELSPVKEFFNSKLKKLQESLKQLAALRNDIQAAGTKKQLLRDVKCLSCDQDAVMLTDASAIQMNQPVRPPPPLSMKPYLTYELDNIRKQQACLVPQRNMRDWENIGKQMTQPKLGRARSATDKHLCNRYCGGSHTVTTPAQRVARTGHFMKQWGPEVVAMNGGMSSGDDAKLCKDTSNERQKGGSGGQLNEPTSERALNGKTDRKSTILKNQECLCLEEEKPTKGK